MSVREALKQRPNFILFITDQHQANHLGCYGNAVVKTPHIDQIAGRGTRFDRFYVTNPFCMPSRSSIITGRMPSAHGVRTNGVPLSLESQTFVESLRSDGYRTALIGKLHLQNMTSAARAYTPSPADMAFDDEDILMQARRFDLQGPAYENESHEKWANDPEHEIRAPYYGFEHVDLCTMHGDLVGGHYGRWLSKALKDPAAVRGRDNALPSSFQPPQSWRTGLDEAVYPSAYIGRQTERWLRDLKASGETRPFFLQCSFPDPHHPFTPPGKYWDMYDPDDVVLPANFGKGDSPMLRHLRKAFESGTANRDTTLPYVVTEKEARETTALTYGAISMVDDQVGVVLQALEDEGLAEDTIVVFMADHGEYMGDYGIMLKGPIHSQSMIRIPLIWTDPQMPGVSSTSALGSALDLSATVLSRAGLLPYHGLQGRSLLPLIQEQQEAHRTEILVEDDREVIYLGFEEPQRVRTLVTDAFRMSLFRPLGYSELFDLKADPHEITNVWNDPNYSDAKASLTERMVGAMADLQDWCPLPTGRA